MTHGERDGGLGGVDDGVEIGDGVRTPDGVVRAHPEPDEPLGRAHRHLVGAGDPVDRPGEADGVGPGHMPRLGHQHVAVAAPALHGQQHPALGWQPHVGDEVRERAAVECGPDAPAAREPCVGRGGVRLQRMALPAGRMERELCEAREGPEREVQGAPALLHGAAFRGFSVRSVDQPAEARPQDTGGEADGGAAAELQQPPPLQRAREELAEVIVGVAVGVVNVTCAIRAHRSSPLHPQPDMRGTARARYRPRCVPLIYFFFQTW